ncbi:MAG: hypothetical protein JSR26_06840 [Proteobacteria bacterium]|nr:hypothetical protein [Pseudomonadota bacterium]
MGTAPGRVENQWEANRPATARPFRRTAQVYQRGPCRLLRNSLLARAKDGSLADQSRKGLIRGAGSGHAPDPASRDCAAGANGEAGPKGEQPQAASQVQESTFSNLCLAAAPEGGTPRTAAPLIHVNEISGQTRYRAPGVRGCH